MLDTIAAIVYTAKQKIRVEQELDTNAEQIPEEVSGPSLPTDAPSSSFRQGGPQPHVQGNPREIGRSTQETEKVLMRGGKMETKNG